MKTEQRIKKSLETLNATIGKKYKVELTLAEWERILEDAGLHPIYCQKCAIEICEEALEENSGQGNHR